MFSTLLTRFGIQGAISVIALVFAMTGGAFAAKYVITSTKQIKPSVLNALKGKPGAAGPQGLPGANGKDGANGTNGANGVSGKDGTSVTNTEFGPTEEEERGFPCEKRGGTELISAEGITYACNGAEGSPWTSGGTLPNGATEKGLWVLTTDSPKIKPGLTEFFAAPISFPIPLKAALEASAVHYIKFGEAAPADCDDGVEPAPSALNAEADPGHLCVFGARESESPTIVIRNQAGTLGADINGALVAVTSSTAPANFRANGSFAVTGGP